MSAEQIHKKILSMSNFSSEIFLLKNIETIQWLIGDLSFLNTRNHKNMQNLENDWGKKLMEKCRPRKKINKQWTNKFGEIVAEEIYILFGKNIQRPMKKQNYQPDLEIDDSIIEVKCGTYFTNGTAHEKILGCPFKYAEIPLLYSKPLKILCIGKAEKISKESYGNIIGPKCSDRKKLFLEFFKQNSIEYIGVTELLIKILDS